MKQNRFKSPVVWAAIVGQIIALGQLTGLWSKFGVDAGVAGDVAAGIIQLGVIVGVLNDPTTADKF
jgi:phi LC3 family holin